VHHVGIFSMINVEFIFNFNFQHKI